MGVDRQPVPVIFDTGTDWTIVSLIDCNAWNCNPRMYYYPASVGSSLIFLDEYWGFRFRDGTEIVTQAATDDVCVLKNTEDCTTGFKWLGYPGELESFPVGGYVGLSSGGRGNTERLLVYNLKADGVISENKFSIVFKDVAAQDSGDRSYIEFGRHDTSAMSDEADLVWLDIIPDSFYWAQYISGVKFGGLDSDVDASFGFESTWAYIDSTAMTITGPKNEVRFIVDALTDVLDVYTYYANNTDYPYFFDCTPNYDNFRPIYLLFGDHWF